MHRSRLATALIVATTLAFGALAESAWAIPLPPAPPTGSQISEPANSTFASYDVWNPGTLHVAGTTSGGAGAIDLLCYAGATYTTIATGVGQANGAFSVDVPVTKTMLDGIGYYHGYCVLRAVPAGTHPAAPPGDQLTPFKGPKIGWGSEKALTLGAGGAPNPAAQVWDYFVTQAQSAAYNDYYSVAGCGLCDTYLYDPATLQLSHPIWWADDALYYRIPYDDYHKRAEAQVDGVDAYGSGGITTELRNNPGMPVLAYSKSVDPLTGDLTINETDPFVSCSPPAGYPATDATCPSFEAPKVTLDRAIVQNHDGRQVTITDRWHSDDAQPHELDALYDDSNTDDLAATVGHESLYDFSWSPTPSFKPYADNTEIAAPAGGPATLYLKSDGSTPDAGDGASPIGALTYGSQPCAIHIQHVPSAANKVWSGDWQARYIKTIPAAGDLVLTQVYSHDYSLASVQALAAEAELALPQVSATQQPCPLPAPPAQTPAPTPAPAPAPATSTAPASAPTSPTTVPVAPVLAPPTPKCRVPEVRGRTLRRAKLMLRHAHCRLGRISRSPSARVRAGRVIGTRPRPGTIRRAGMRIAVELASSRLR